MTACFECNSGNARHRFQTGGKYVNIQFSREIESRLCHLGNASHFYSFVIVCRLFWCYDCIQNVENVSETYFGNNFSFLDSFYSNYFLRCLFVPLKNVIIATIWQHFGISFFACFCVKTCGGALSNSLFAG